ncbi:HNH endonuclease signature motif containing protein [Serinicoccus kebangsaanensis]|uniref:HNH endonuclease signature motif containing protein n=1 Tax=Serinicoccus kebangsaanensis TaxID=2602069 RepID=UPI00124CC179|nr:HNH endonuclease signature motif containing protein [Serinicoccus kebangsaanensis]
MKGRTGAFGGSSDPSGGAPGGDLGWVQQAELVSRVERLGEVIASSRASLVALVREGVGRGLHVEAGFSVPDWVRLLCPGLSVRDATEVAVVARAGQDPVHRALVEAVEDGRVPLARAARVVRALERVRGGVEREEYASAVTLLAGAAAQERFTEKDLDRVCRRLVAACTSRREQDERARAMHGLRDLHETSLGDGSVRRFVLTVGDDADCETIRAVLMSPLAAPASREEQEATGEVDSRTAGQRRYDAFMTVLRRGVAGTRGQPTTPKAQVMVTVTLDALREELAGVGSGADAGRTVHGGALSAEEVRRLACEADLIPAVLGSRGEILDLGRARRLVTPGQRVALAHRDDGCTFPGCSVPATWCDAHHVVHWAHGGRSDLGNYALLCPRHHTWVHQHEPSADVDAHGVRWRLRP